jgi:tetratricopeptide (TPR) repeat protein
MSRVLIAGRAVWFYLGKLLWPAGLSFSYARWHIDPANPWQYLWPVACIIAAVALAKSGRGLKTAALYYVAMLAPLLGFIPEYTFRYTFVADHYQYAASIGPLALAASGMDRLLRRFGQAGNVMCGCLLMLLCALTWHQCRNYADSETLWRATLESTPNSTIARNNLSQALLEKKQFDESMTLSREVLAGNANDPVALNNLGFALLELGRVAESIPQFQHAIAAQPNGSSQWYNLGRACLEQKRFEEAVTNFQTAIRLKPDFANAWCNLGYALLRTGQVPAAISNYQAAIALDPDNPLAHNDLGSILLKQGDTTQARQHFERAVSLAPDFVEARYNLGGLLLASGQLDGALSQYEKVTQLRPQLAGAHYMLGKLAAAYAKAGQPDRAVDVCTRALELARAAGETNLADNLAAQLRSLRESN